MTLETAIETLEEMRETTLNYYSPRRKNALKLGIEAMKRVKKERTGYERFAPDLLPGETGE